MKIMESYLWTEDALDATKNVWQHPLGIRKKTYEYLKPYSYYIIEIYGLARINIHNEYSSESFLRKKWSIVRNIV